jgi:two-component system NtrC family sensor kinase
MELRAVSIADVLQDPEYTLSEGQAIAGYRSTLGVPLLRENKPLKSKFFCVAVACR